MKPHIHAHLYEPGGPRHIRSQFGGVGARVALAAGSLLTVAPLVWLAYRWIWPPVQDLLGNG